MDKDFDFQTYETLVGQASQIHIKQVLHTRILKLSSAESPTSYEKIGLELGKSKQFGKSLTLLKRATIIDPDSTRAHLKIIKTFFSLKKENEAFSSMERALCLSPTNYSLHSFIIRTFQERDKLKDLEPFYQEVADMITDKKLLPSLFYQCAQALVGINQYSHSLFGYKKAIETCIVEEPGYLHHFQYAGALYYEGFLEEALIHSVHAWRLNPYKNLAKNNIAFLNYCLGRVQKALEEFEFIIDNGLEIYATYSNFLVVLYHLDKDEETINKYKGLLQPYIQPHYQELSEIYNEELRQTDVRLQGEIDEETREFYLKKLKGLNFVVSHINKRKEEFDAEWRV